jgi:hypothetical protein
VVKADRISRICDIRLGSGQLTASWTGHDQAMVGGAEQLYGNTNAKAAMLILSQRLERIRPWTD